MKLRLMITMLALTLLLAIVANAAPTGTVEMKYLGHGAAPYKTVSLYADADGTYDYDAGTGYEVAYGGNVVAGYYKFDTRNGVDEGTSVPDPLMGFCLDLVENPHNTWKEFDVLPLTEAPDPTFIGTTITEAKASMLRELWGENYSTTMGAQQAAEFQLAVWEITFETSGTYDISSGSLYSNHYNTGTQALLDAIDGSGPMANLRALSNAGEQDILCEIPAPGAVLLGGIGVGLVGWLRRKRTF